MDPMVSGLRFRVSRAARQIPEQHRHLGELLAALVEALAAEGLDVARELFTQYEGALDAHFALEDEVFFPALHGLHPEHGPELDRLSRDHDVLRRACTRLRERIADKKLALVRRELDELVEGLGRHEDAEERLVSPLVHLANAS